MQRILLHFRIAHDLRTVLRPALSQRDRRYHQYRREDCHQKKFPVHVLHLRNSKGAWSRFYPWYFPMMACSRRAVASGHKFGAVKIAFFRAEPHLQARGCVPRALTACFMINWALRTFLLRYSITVSTVTASCPGCQQS